MVDFSISEVDEQILAQIKAEGKAGEKYTRYYEDNEEELTKNYYPEAEEFPPIMDLLKKRSFDDTPGATFQMLLGMQRAAGLGISLRTGKGALGNAALAAAGTEEQKAKWGGTTLAMSITEPGTGSDTKAIVTTARLDGDEWVINGDKIFVTTGIRCEGVVVWATVDKAAGRSGIKSFIVMKDTPGYNIVRKEKKLGIRTSDTAAYNFDECRIPRENLLGGDESVPKPGQGSASYKGVLKTFNMTRPGVAAGGIGKARGALDWCVDALADEGVEVDWESSAHNRTSVQQTLVEMEADTDAAALTVLRAAWLADKGQGNNVEASVSKSKGGDVCRTVPQRAMNLLGAMSISHDHLVEVFLRDGRISDIYEGTGQIQRLIIARNILGFSSAELS